MRGRLTSIQSAMARTLSSASRPSGVSLYSTCGGTTFKAVRYNAIAVKSHRTTTTPLRTEFKYEKKFVSTTAAKNIDFAVLQAMNIARRPSVGRIMPAQSGRRPVALTISRRRSTLLSLNTRIHFILCNWRGHRWVKRELAF